MTANHNVLASPELDIDVTLRDVHVIEHDVGGTCKKFMSASLINLGEDIAQEEAITCFTAMYPSPIDIAETTVWHSEHVSVAPNSRIDVMVYTSVSCGSRIRFECRIR